jgi:polysaccharide biosynthesis protein PslH
LQNHGNPERLRLLVVSHVLPFPGDSGQQQRVRLTLQSLRSRFHVTVAVPSSSSDEAVVREKLLEHCDDVIIVPSGADDGMLAKSGKYLAGAVYCSWSGEKWSNYVIGQLQFSPSRMGQLADSGHYDCVLYEYWHANASTEVFRSRGIPTVLDMHNILWQALDRQLKGRRLLPSWVRRPLVARYRKREERAWARYDGLIAVNRAEHGYASTRVKRDIQLFHVPMGVQLDRWTYRWNPAQPPRIAYYGGLTSLHNQRSARECVLEIMPIIWEEYPTAEIWVVGSNPPPDIVALAGDRVKVTGFMEDVGPILGLMSAVLCPWKGTYGFRSRVIEAMALGIPVIVTPDAVYGMDLDPGRGLVLAESVEEMAGKLIELLRDPALAREHSLAARQQVTERFAFGHTYGRFAVELEQWLRMQRAPK